MDFQSIIPMKEILIIKSDWELSKWGQLNIISLCSEIYE